MKTSQQSETLKIALPQIAPIWLDRDATLAKVVETIQTAAAEKADLIVFGEGLVPGYPFWVDATGGAAFDNLVQKELYAHYSREAVCIEDGHLDSVCAALKAASMACYLGIIERPLGRSGHSHYASFVYIDKQGNIGSVHRKLMPTHEERLVWAVGDGNGLRTHPLGAFTVGGLNCWENWMPLTRAALYGQGENLHVACWPGSVRNTHDITPMIAKEGRSYVISVSSLMRKSDVPDDIPHSRMIKDALAADMPADGGSCIAAPDGSWVLEPSVGVEDLRYAEIDMDFVRRERALFDPVGHYSRPDVLSLNINRKRQSCVNIDDD